MYGKAIEPTKGGVNIGTDIAIPVGTEISVPSGEWKVLSTKTGIKGGNITDYKKTPYGNSILVQNTETGEKLRFSHLSEVAVSNGDVIDTGTYIGKSGKTGNTTGAHLDLEYYTNKGNLADVMKSPYGKHYTGSKLQDMNEGLTALKDLGNIGKKAVSKAGESILQNLFKNTNTTSLDDITSFVNLL